MQINPHQSSTLAKGVVVIMALLTKRNSMEIIVQVLEGHAALHILDQ